MKIIISECSICEEVWMGCRQFNKSGIWTLFLKHFGVRIHLNCLFICWYFPHIPIFDVYLKHKETNQPFLNPLLIWWVWGLSHGARKVHYETTNLGFLRFPSGAESGNWVTAPHVSLTDTIKSVWKKTCLFRGDRHVLRLNSSSLEFSSCHTEVFLGMKFYLICSALFLLRHDSLRIQHRWKLRSDFFSSFFVILCLLFCLIKILALKVMVRVSHWILLHEEAMGVLHLGLHI